MRTQVCTNCGEEKPWFRFSVYKNARKEVCRSCDSYKTTVGRSQDELNAIHGDIMDSIGMSRTLSAEEIEDLKTVYEPPIPFAERQEVHNNASYHMGMD